MVVFVKDFRRGLVREFRDGGFKFYCGSFKV